MCVCVCCRITTLRSAEFDCRDVRRSGMCLAPSRMPPSQVSIPPMLVFARARVRGVGFVTRICALLSKPAWGCIGNSCGNKMGASLSARTDEQRRVQTHRHCAHTHAYFHTHIHPLSCVYTNDIRRNGQDMSSRKPRCPSVSSVRFRSSCSSFFFFCGPSCFKTSRFE